MRLTLLASTVLALCVSIGSASAQDDIRKRGDKACGGDSRKMCSKFFGDDSYQRTGTSGETTRDNTPSVAAAIPTETKIGESGGESVQLWRCLGEP